MKDQKDEYDKKHTIYSDIEDIRDILVEIKVKAQTKTNSNLYYRIQDALKSCNRIKILVKDTSKDLRTLEHNKELKKQKWNMNEKNTS